jgi:hypothetical protein
VSISIYKKKKPSQTIISDVIMPMCEFAPESFVNILKIDVSPNSFRDAWNHTFVEEFSHLCF